MAVRLSFFRLGLRLVALAALLAGQASASLAAEPLKVDPQARIELDIAAQDLVGALDAFSRQTGMAVLVDRDLTRARRSLAVQGRYRPSEALGLLLTGSGLMARYARADAFTLQVAQVSGASPRGSAGKGGALAGSYARAIQQAIERALCAVPLTRPGSYRALLQVWIGPGGELQHSRLVSSTGNVQRDGALVERLRTVRVEQAAPSSLRQPVTLLLTPDSSGTSMDCIDRKGAAGV